MTQGLVVPVIRNVETMNFADIEKTINYLGEKVRQSSHILPVWGVTQSSSHILPVWVLHSHPVIYYQYVT